MFESPDPSILNELSHTQQQVLRGLVVGQSISAAARAAGVHRATVYLWIRTVPTFTRALDAHRRLRADRIADDLNDLADSALSALREIIDNTASPAAVRYKAAMDVITFTQNHAEEGRLYRESNLLASFHAELNAIATATVPASTRDEYPAPNEPIEESTEEAITEPTQATPIHGSPVRNSPCPCGSRLKYKRCCGKIPLQARAA